MSPTPTWEPPAVVSQEEVLRLSEQVKYGIKVASMTFPGRFYFLDPTLERCQRSLPLFEALKPPSKVRAVSLGAGIHSWSWTDEKLPRGVAPPVAKLWHDAIMNGFFTT